VPASTVAQLSGQAPFIHEIVGSIFLFPTHVKIVSQRSAFVPVLSSTWKNVDKIEG
jgi:hypothetical protein